MANVPRPLAQCSVVPGSAAPQVQEEFRGSEGAGGVLSQAKLALRLGRTAAHDDPTSQRSPVRVPGYTRLLQAISSRCRRLK